MSKYVWVKVDKETFKKFLDNYPTAIWEEGYRQGELDCKRRARR